jgi:hypothetical protein
MALGVVEGGKLVSGLNRKEENLMYNQENPVMRHD